jgi:hypothetical protein
MTLINSTQLANTKQKLDELVSLYQAKESQSGGDEELRELTMESLMRLINQLKEEIARFESHQVVKN